MVIRNAWRDASGQGHLLISESRDHSETLASDRRDGFVLEEQNNNCVLVSP